MPSERQSATTSDSPPTQAPQPPPRPPPVQVIQPLKFDFSSTLKAFRDFVQSTTQCTNPQLIVSCRGEKRAFGRSSLKGMGYDRAASLFITRFARNDDWVEPSQKSWKSWRYPPEVEMYATFCRAHADDTPKDSHLHQDPVALDSTGWADVMENVEMLEVIMRRKGE